jgi:hypothetical protein
MGYGISIRPCWLHPSRSNARSYRQTAKICLRSILWKIGGGSRLTRSKALLRLGKAAEVAFE